jgi:hypothetical protein
VTGAPQFWKGAFIAYEQRGFPNVSREIRFYFNPESLTRNIAVQAAQSAEGTEGAAPARPANDTTAADTGGTLKESFSITIRVDAEDRNPPPDRDLEQYGVAPQIAAIEDLLYPAQTDSESTSTGQQGVKKARPRPTVLFVWGPKRILPVRIASLKIDESVYNTLLHPVRAEIEVSLEVLGEAEARHDKAVRAALKFTDRARRELAGKFYANPPKSGNFKLPKLPE